MSELLLLLGMGVCRSGVLVGFLAVLVSSVGVLLGLFVLADGMMMFGLMVVMCGGMMVRCCCVMVFACRVRSLRHDAISLLCSPSLRPQRRRLTDVPVPA